jgi:hypothetical protein
MKPKVEGVNSLRSVGEFNKEKKLDINKMFTANPSEYKLIEIPH